MAALDPSVDGPMGVIVFEVAVALVVTFTYAVR